MLKAEHSAILSTFIKLPYAIKTFVLSIIEWPLRQVLQYFMCLLPDAKQAFHLYDKKGNGEVATKELASIFKALSLHVDDEKLKDWADEADEEGMPSCA